MLRSTIYAITIGLALSSPGHARVADMPSIATQLLSSGQINLSADTLTVPLHHGHLKDGRDVWYVLIDASDRQIAEDKGLVYAPALANSAEVARQASTDADGDFVFDRGVVDFSAVHSVTPGDVPNLFPPKVANPGSVGDASYSPYVIAGGVIYNAPAIAFAVSSEQIKFCHGGVDHSIVHDKVVAICPESGTATLALSHGFAAGHPLIYVSLDANNTVAAAMESATYAPALSALAGSPATLPLYAVVNGETGKDNPKRQGFDSALSGDGSPLNVLTGIPTLSQTPYSPLWELHIAQWTMEAVQTNERMVLTSAREFAQLFQAGELANFGGGSGVLPSSGLLVNCPAVAILK